MKKIVASLTVMSVILSIIAIAPFSRVYAADVVKQKQMVIYNGLGTNYELPGCIEENRGAIWDSPPWGGDKTYRYVSGADYIIYKINLPGNCADLFFYAFDYPNGKMELSKDKVNWIDTTYKLSSGNGGYFVSENQSILENNPQRTVYIKISSSNTLQYMWGSLIAMFKPFAQESSDTGSFRTDGGTNEQSRIFQQGSTETQQVWDGMILRKVNSGQSITYAFTFPQSTSRVTFTGSIANDVKVSVSGDNTTFTETKSGSFTFEPGVMKEIAVATTANALSGSGLKTVYLKIESFSGASGFAFCEILGYSAEYSSAVFEKALLNNAPVVSDDEFVFEKSNDVTLGSGIRTIPDGSYITYLYEYGQNITGVLNLLTTSMSEADIKLSKDNTSWVNTTCSASGLEYRYMPENQSFLEDNPNRKLYIKIAAKGGAENLYLKLILNCKTEIESEQRISFAPSEIADANNMTGEIVYLYDTADTAVSSNIRTINTNGYAVYKFDLNNSASFAKLMLELKNEVLIKVSSSGLTWTKLTDSVINSNPSAMRKIELDITSLLEDNPNKIIYIRLENAGGSPVQISEISLDFKYQSIDIPDTENNINSIFFRPFSTSFATLEPQYIYDQHSSYSYYWDALGCNIRRFINNKSYVTYMFKLPNNTTEAAAIITVKYQYKISVSTDGSQYTLLDYSTDLKTGDPIGEQKTVTLDLGEYLKDNPNKTLYLRIGNYDSSVQGGLVSTEIKYITKGTERESNIPYNSGFTFGPGTQDDARFLYKLFNVSDSISDTIGWSKTIYGDGFAEYKFNIENNAKDGELVVTAINQLRVCISNDRRTWHELGIVEKKLGEEINASFSIGKYLQNNYNKEFFIRFYSSNPAADYPSILTNIGVRYLVSGLDYEDLPVNLLEDENGFTYYRVPIGFDKENPYIEKDTNGVGKSFSVNDYEEGSFFSRENTEKVRHADLNDSVTYKFTFSPDVNSAVLNAVLACEYNVELSSDNKNFDKITTSKFKTQNIRYAQTIDLNVSKYLINNPSKTVYVRFSDPTGEDRYGTAILDIFVRYKSQPKSPEDLMVYNSKNEIYYGESIFFDVSTSYEKEYIHKNENTTIFDYFYRNVRVANENDYVVYKFELPSNTYSANFVYKAFLQYNFSVSPDDDYYIDVAYNPDLFVDTDGELSVFKEADITDFLEEGGKKVLYIKCSDYTFFDRRGAHVYALGVEYTTRGPLTAEKPEHGNANTGDKGTIYGIIFSLSCLVCTAAVSQKINLKKRRRVEKNV